MRKSLIHLMEIGIAWPSHFLFTTFWTCTLKRLFVNTFLVRNPCNVLCEVMSTFSYVKLYLLVIFDI